MEIHKKHCFIIEYDFSNGHPINCFEDRDLNYKGRDWWTDTGDHENNKVFAEIDDNIVCDLQNEDGSQATMSCLYVSVPKVDHGGREALHRLRGAIGSLKRCELDELVHEAASEKASMINNKGIDSQLEFLISEIGVEEILARV